mgnify:CR=1 FL=1|tara:strand:+ start:249 stop:593 length:345 start_codon:yes stop_codon:yes gene_type:complete
MTCNCDCHKQDNMTKLKKCEDRGRAKDKKIKELEKKCLTLTLVAAIIGTIVGKETVDKVLEYFETFDKVQNVVNVPSNSSIDPINPPMVYGVTPSVGTLPVFGLMLFQPVRRRR